MSEINYNKIINNAARQTLKPFRLFQKGSSRTWIDDNGWYFTIVEFQPSNWAKGSYLNVSIHYLWSNNDYLTFDYGNREHEFVTFTGDCNQFFNDMLLLSEQALKKIFEYRKFKDITYAKKKILSHDGFSSLSRELYEKMMIRGLAMDEKASIYANKLMKEVEYSTLSYDIDYYEELSEKILPIIENEVEFYEYIMNKIAIKRALWRSKANMKKLPIDELYL